MKTLPVAVQVYSVREDAEKDFAGTMKKIKEIGYDGVELAGLYGLEPAAIKAAIEDAGLVALSAHVPFQELVADMEGTIQKYVEIGMKVKVAGEDPAAYVKKYTGRSPLVHLKDFHKEGRPANMYQLIGTEVEEQESHGTFEFRPVGHGDQDFPPILEASVEAGAQWVVVEQDQSNGRTPMEAITLSREYLKSQGW